MPDRSELDRKYFIDSTVYNCPYCNRNNVPYIVRIPFSFDWKEDKKCYGFLAKCVYCKNESLHLSWEDIIYYSSGVAHINSGIDIDSKIFYSVPTSFFTLDNRMPSIVRELITEAENSLKMNFLTGASACMRKAIYELLIIEKTVGNSYEDKIKSLKSKYPDTDPTYFDTLAHIQDMTSDKIHEQSWDKWDSKNLKLIIETLKSVLYDIYVLPQIKSERSKVIQQLRETLVKDQKPNQEP